MEQKLGIRYQNLRKAFTERFVPKLMDLALKDLRKAAEQEMGGIQSGGIASNSNLNELKSVISKTTKVTKVARGAEQDRPEDVTQEVSLSQAADKAANGSDEDEDGTDNDKSMDVVMDTDGNQKKATFKYDNEDDLQSEAGSSNVAMSEQGGAAAMELAVDFTNVNNVEENANEYMKFLREKCSKYLPYIKGDLEFNDGRSASVTL